VQKGRAESVQGAHALPFNERSLSFCLKGGIDRFGGSVPNFTDAQLESLQQLLGTLTARCPEAAIRGHGDPPGIARDYPLLFGQPLTGDGRGAARAA
jgi:N-acetyl-anhydromuramyl-L-alanine amidase AmpD